MFLLSKLNCKTKSVQARLSHRRLRVVRIETTADTQRIVGLLVPNAAVETVLQGSLFKTQFTFLIYYAFVNCLHKRQKMDIYYAFMFGSDFFFWIWVLFLLPG